MQFRELFPDFNDEINELLDEANLNPTAIDPTVTAVINTTSVKHSLTHTFTTNLY